MTGLGSLWSEKQGSYFFHQEDENTDNTQDDGDAAHGDDDSGEPIEKAAPRETCRLVRHCVQGRMAIHPCNGRGGRSGTGFASQVS
jgi:hypothetical protein